MSKKPFPFAVRTAVRHQAEGCCEYCKSQDKFSPNAFTIDHVLPESLGGSDNSENLAYCCFLCNRLKSNKLVGFDLVSETNIPLFHPRRQQWKEHFSWSDDATLVLGITPAGRATVETLRLNRPKLIEYRKCLYPLGLHPPA